MYVYVYLPKFVTQLVHVKWEKVLVTLTLLWIQDYGKQFLWHNIITRQNQKS